MPLDLSVLDGRPAQEVVQLDRLVGGHAGLVLAGLIAQPEVDVLLQPRPLGLADLKTKHNKELTYFFFNNSRIRIETAK